MMEEKKLPLSQFVIRIVALLTMTCDHIGVFMMSEMGYDYAPAFILRIIGRLAFPLFAFMLAEGLAHTHNTKRYLLRIGGMLAIMLVLEAIITYVLKMHDFQGNPFLDLLLYGLVIFFLSYLEKPGKKKWIALLSLLPLAYLGISYGVFLYEHLHRGLVSVVWFPPFIRSDYNIFGLLLVLGFYYAHKIADLLAKKPAELEGASLDAYKESVPYQKMYNILAMIVLLVVVVAFWGVSYIGIDPATGFRPLDILQMSTQSYCLLILPLLYFYNGKRGYDSKIFRIFNYLYFPVHLVLIFAVFALIFAV